jgi:hypothetical protein
MEDPAGAIAQTDAADIEPTDRKLSPLECLGGVIVSPVKTFERLASNPQWFVPLIVVCLYVLVAFVARMAAVSIVGMSMIGEDLAGMGRRAFFTFIALFSSGIMFLMGVVAAVLVIGAMAGALYAILRAFGIKSRFFALVSALTCAEVVPRLVGSSLKRFIPLLSGNLRIFEPGFPTGILPIFSEFDLPLLAECFLARIELFHLWSFALTAIAVRFVAKVSSERAMLITLLYWAVCILVVAGASFSWEFITTNLFPY